MTSIYHEYRLIVVDRWVIKETGDKIDDFSELHLN